MIAPIKTSNPLSLYFVFSIAIHIICVSIFHILIPKQKEYIKKSMLVEFMNTRDISTSSIENIADNKSMECKKSKITAPSQKSRLPISQKSNLVKTTPTIQNKIKQNNPSTSVKQAIPQPQLSREEKMKLELTSDLDKILDASAKQYHNNDLLSDATWSGQPRKTIFFPDLAQSIPERYHAKGYGFSVTAKITFDPQGWVSSLELLHTSGDPYIDSIFRIELRKIQIEHGTSTVYDTIVKTFTISVK